MPGYLEMILVFAMAVACGIVAYVWTGERRWQKKRQTFANISEAIVEDQEPSVEEILDSGPETVPDRVLFRHERIQQFYADFVLPYEKILSGNHYLRPVRSLLSLLDLHGDCPSVVQADQDHEYQAVQKVYDLLSKITLLDHSLNVAEQMIAGVMKAKTRDPEMIMGKVLVSALGHDIGKIPSLINAGTYRKGDHPYISYLVLKNAIFTETSPQHEDILTAVKSHHYPIREGFTHDLRKADQAAREMEAEQLSLQGHSTGELVRIIHEQTTPETMPETQINEVKTKAESPKKLDLSWLVLDEFLGLIEPEINRVLRDSYFRAFSMSNGLVYLMLSLVSETVIQLARKHNHPEVLVNADTTEKKRNIEYTVKTLLAEKGYIPSFIGQGFSGARFGLFDANGKKKMVGIYMPVEARAFQTSLSELENKKNKASVIKEIAEVRPLVGRKK